nr:hypothetical protein [Bdellovibrionales bacterium]
MNFLEDLLELWDGDETQVDLESADYSFLDNGSEADELAIEKIQDKYGLDTQGAEEFLEITQSIQHSLGDGLADQETLANIDN